MEEFVRRYEQLYPKMYRTAYYYMQNAEEAEDAVSDAVLTAYEKRNQLKDKERFIVALSVFGGYTSEEIAWILNKNHSTIRSKYRRALQKMKDKLEV